jgi:signal transduction histidine kinase
MGAQLRSAGIAVNMMLAEDLPTVLGDATALERVVVNLLSNAHDVCRREGR